MQFVQTRAELSQCSRSVYCGQFASVNRVNSLLGFSSPFLFNYPDAFCVKSYINSNLAHHSDQKLVNECVVRGRQGPNLICRLDRLRPD